MNLDTHIRDIWIAVGVLSGFGLILAFFRASVWQTRAGREFVDLYVSEATNSARNIVDVFASLLERRLAKQFFTCVTFSPRPFSSSWPVCRSGG